MTHRTLLPLVVAAVSAALVGRAEDWPEFRGPTGQGLSTAEKPPLEWNTTKNVAWRKKIAGKGWSSPIVTGGRIFLTTAVPLSDAGDQSLRALSLDAASGDERWSVEVFRQQPARIHSKNSHASPTPLTDGKVVFVHFGTTGTACLDLDGKVVWRNQGLEYKPVHGGGGSPALTEAALVINCDGGDRQFVVALDRKTGQELWRTPRPLHSGRGFSFSTPLVIESGGRKQVVSPGSDHVVSYDPRNGAEIWRVQYPGGYSVVPRPVHGHGLVFVCSGFDSPTLLAIRPDGNGDVTRSHVVWTLRRGVPLNPTPLLVGDELYIVSDKGIASCLDARTGKEHWRQRIGGNHSASPVHAGGRIFFQSEDGEGIVLEASTTFKELARNPLGERSLASFAVAASALFVRTVDHLYRIER